MMRASGSMDEVRVWRRQAAERDFSRLVQPPGPHSNISKSHLLRYGKTRRKNARSACQTENLGAFLFILAGRSLRDAKETARSRVLVFRWARVIALYP